MKKQKQLKIQYTIRILFLPFASNIASYPPICAPPYAGNQTNSIRLRFAVEPGLTTWS